jgi:hypothetical protein
VIRAAVTGVFGYVPPDVLTNAELAKMVDTSHDRDHVVIPGPQALRDRVGKHLI